MIELREQIQAILKTIHPTIYSKNSIDIVDFPYMVYSTPNSFFIEDQEVFNLDIDIWDMPEDGDTTIIETLSNEVWNKLNKLKYIDENIQFSIYRMNRMNVENEDKRIERRKLIFSLKFYDRRI